MTWRWKPHILLATLSASIACPAPPMDEPPETTIFAAQPCDTRALDPIALDEVAQTSSPLPRVFPRLDVLLLAPQPHSKDCASGLKTSTPCSDSAAFCQLRFSEDEPERVALLLVNPTARDVTIYALRVTNPCSRLWVGDGSSERGHEEGDTYRIDGARGGHDDAHPFILYLQHAADGEPCSTTLEIESDAYVGENDSGYLFVDIDWS